MISQTSDLRFQIEKDVFLAGIQRVQGVIDRKGTMPILSNVLLEGLNSSLNIVATDLEIGIKGTYPANIQRKGAIAVSGRKLHEIIKELPKGSVDIAVEDGKYVTIKSGRSYFKLAGTSGEDFPSLPEVKEDQMILMDAKIYREMINKTIFAVADADARHVLNGAFLEIGGDSDRKSTIRMVGTDGHKLAVYECSIEISQPKRRSGTPKSNIIVSKKTLHELQRLLEVNEEIKIGIGEKEIFFKGKDIFMTSRLIEGNYPNYKQVIPQKVEQVVRVNRSDLMRVIRRVSVMSRERTKAIIFEFLRGKAILRASDPEIGEAAEDIRVGYEGPGLKIGLNSQYLLEALDVIDGEDVIMEMQTNVSPCVIRQENAREYLCIVMPLRLQETE